MLTGHRFSLALWGVVDDPRVISRSNLRNILHHALRNVEEASLHACLLVFVGHMTGNPPGANLPLAETFMNNAPDGASGKIKP
jgi:hypothetical protein